jgi:hypothetical protein
MTFKKLIGFAILVLISSIAYAEMVAHYTGGPVGLVSEGADGKKAGDVISVNTDTEIASLCNFTSQIVVTKTSVLCVFNGKQPPQ